jgi:hypothetical protein
MDSRLDELCNDIAMWVPSVLCSLFLSLFPSIWLISSVCHPFKLEIDSGKEKVQRGLVAGRRE